VEGVEHDYVVEVCASGVEGRLNALKSAAYLGFESGGIFSFTVSPTYYDTGDVECVAYSA
jgi:hypothetical protein